MSNSLESLVVALFDKEAIGYAKSDHPTVVGPPHGFYTLEDGRKSPNYVNMRAITSLSERIPGIDLDDQRWLRERVINALDNTILEVDDEHNHILGIPHAMTALSAMVSYNRGESVLSLTNETKPHGITRTIDGDYRRGDIVLGLCGVVRASTANLEAFRTVRQNGLQIEDLVTLVDRQEGGEQALKNDGITTFSVLTIGGITAMLRAANKIGDKQVNWTAQYFQDLVEKNLINHIPPELAGLV